MAQQLNRYSNQTAVDSDNRGYILETDHTSRENRFAWRFHISARVYTFQEYRVPRAYLDGLPPLQDAQTMQTFHGTTPPKERVLDDNTPTATYIQKLYSTREITDNVMKNGFQGYEVFAMPEGIDGNAGPLGPLPRNREADPDEIKEIYPVYRAANEEEANAAVRELGFPDWAHAVVSKYLQLLYKPHYLETIKSQKIMSINPASTWNDTPLFDYRRSFFHELFDMAKEESVLPRDIPFRGSCVSQVIWQSLLDRPSTDHGSVLAARSFVRQHYNKGVTIHELSQFIESLRNVSLIVFDPCNRCVHASRTKNKSNGTRLIVCRIEDNHLHLITDKRIIYANNYTRLGDLMPGLPKERDFDVEEWARAEFVNDIEREMMNGSNRILVYDEGDYRPSESGQRGMIYLMRLAMEKTNFKIPFMRWDHQGPSVFRMPLSKNVIIRSKDYQDRKELMQYLLDVFMQGGFPGCLLPKSKFKWTNQSYGQISLLFYEALGFSTNLTKSRLRVEIRNIFKNSFSVGPMHRRVCSDSDAMNAHQHPHLNTYDCVRQYSSIMYQCKYPWNVFSNFSEFEDCTICHIDQLVPGEYYVSQSFCLAHPSMIVRAGCYPSAFLLACFQRGFLDLSLITRKMQAEYILPPDHFRVFFEQLYQLPDPDNKRRKTIANFFVGMLGKHTETHDTTFFTDNQDIRDAAVNAYGESLDVLVINDFAKPIYLCRVREEKPIYHTGMPIARQVYCLSWINLSDMWATLRTPTATLMSYKSDALTIMDEEKLPEDIELYDGLGKQKKLEDLGKIHLEMPHVHSQANERRILRPYERELWHNDVRRALGDKRCLHWNCLERDQVNIDTLVAMNGCFITGAGGTGKTYLIKKLIERFPDDHVVLCYQNLACANIRAGVPNCNAHTFDSYFQNSELQHLVSEECLNPLKGLASKKWVIIDEFSQVPPRYYDMMYTAWVMSFKQLKFIIAGDINQTRYIAGKDEFRYHYPSRQMFRFLCGGNQLTLRHIEGVTRCNWELQNGLDELLKTHRLPRCFMNRLPKAELYRTAYHICKFRTAQKINVTNINKELAPESGLITQGARIICNVNLKKIHFYNGNMYEVMSLYDGGGGGVVLQGMLSLRNEEAKSIPKNVLTGKTGNIPNFEFNYAQTVHRIQGQTLSRDVYPIIFVHSVAAMSIDEIYTALSRAQCLEQLYLVPYHGKFRPPSFSQDSVVRVFRKEKSTIYANGKIYQILDDVLPEGANCVYVGQTVREIEEEFGDQITCARQTFGRKDISTSRALIKYMHEKMKDNRMEDLRVQLLERFPCFTHRQLLDAETSWIEKKTKEGHPLTNRRQLPPEREPRPLFSACLTTDRREEFNRYIEEMENPSNVNVWTLFKDGKRLRAVNAVDKKKKITCSAGMDEDYKLCLDTLRCRIQAMGGEPEFIVHRNHESIHDLIHSSGIHEIDSSIRQALQSLHPSEALPMVIEKEEEEEKEEESEDEQSDSG